MPADGSPDTPMAVQIEAEAEVAPVALVEEPKRRRVRRKTSASATEASEPEAVTEPVEPNEAEPVAAEVAELDVTPAEAVEERAEAPAPEPKPAPVADYVAPQPEIDVAALIADDPAQIVAPPEKPKRGWWRR